MAKVWIVMVLVFAQNVFAADNEDDITNQNCDACIRSAKSWCNRVTSEGHCFSSTRDDACPGNDVDKLAFHETINRNGDLFQPEYAERNLYLTDLDYRRMSVTYASAEKKNVTIGFVNVRNEDSKIDVQEGDTQCDGTKCSVDILAKASKDFCSYFEFIDVAIKFEGFSEYATVRYNVPCACACTSKPEPKSKECTYHGNYTCGICTCESEWTGERCNSACSRGDTPNQLCMPKDGSVNCYGNGRCVCDSCECFKNGVGSQYFDPSEQCANICTQTIECSACLRKETLGECDTAQCSRFINVVPLNDTIVTTEVDEKNRTVWVHCKEKADGFYFDYYTMRTEEYYYVMINNKGNTAIAVGQGTDAGAAGATSTKVPLILGILGVVAVLAAVGGVMLWKHMNALPALPMSDPGYAHMDAEDCTGENPLYRPPTSSFKNPTYGKW